MKLRAALAAAAMLVLAGCPQKPKPDPVVTDASITPALVVEHTGDAMHGLQLMADYQCNRCHDGTGQPAPEQKKDCVKCHADIIEGRFKAPEASLARWKPRVKELVVSPSLTSTGKRFDRRWVESYLLQPMDLRPHLQQYMPRLSMTTNDAKDIAAYLAGNDDKPASGAETKGADLGKGRQLLETRGCGSCHVFTGVAALPPSSPPAMDAKEFDRGNRLAPDLRFARTRMNAAKMIAWLQDPKAIKADTPMPKILSAEEAKDVTAYILEAEMTPPPAKPKFERLPLLGRKVAFKEVDDKVFHRTCWHCHSEPDYAIGDGGPGNSGGFGFKPRGLNLSDYAGITAGYLDAKGERASIFAKDKDSDGVPRIVRALIARHDEEEQGGETGPVRGMPLGYDALSAEDIQLVESWVAQGRPR